MNERITIELSQPTAEQLKQLAAARGVSVECLAAEFVSARAHAAGKMVLDLMDEVLEEFDELHQRLA
jgi:hypothetical protein